MYELNELDKILIKKTENLFLKVNGITCHFKIPKNMICTPIYN